MAGLDDNGERLETRWVCLTGVNRGWEVDVVKKGVKDPEAGRDERNMEPSSSSAEIGCGIVE